MGWGDNLFKSKAKSEPVESPVRDLNPSIIREAKALMHGSVHSPQARYESSSGTYRTLFAWSYNGEKNLGEMGPMRDYRMDYHSLRIRSWQCFVESEVAQMALKRFVKWGIGSGLKLQAEPNKTALRSEGIPDPPEDFNEITEARFKVYCESKRGDYANNMSLNEMASEALKCALVGGDVLMVLRYNGGVTVQLIDGASVEQPHYLINGHKTASGSIICNGIEQSDTGRHIAYYVRKNGPIAQYDRIEAYGKQSNVRMAVMIYGNTYRTGENRGMPLIAVVMETIKKMERYKEATVGSAEERQKIAYYIHHGVSSDGENPMMRQLAKAVNPDAEDDIPTDVNGTQLANTIAVSTNKQVFNMPIDSDLKSLESKNELYFKDFYTVNIELVCGAIGIPPNVAMSKYDSNFSASRAALKDWEYSLTVDRKYFASQFYAPIYELWMATQVLENKINAPGYLQALYEDNYMITQAYHQARFVGASVPHIDPEKEVRAERLKLGTLADHIPLTTVEQSTEVLNGGDSDANMSQFSEELKYSDGLGLKAVEKAPAPVIEKPDEK